MCGHRQYLDTLVDIEVTNTGPIQITSFYDSILWKISVNIYFFTACFEFSKDENISENRTKNDS